MYKEAFHCVKQRQHMFIALILFLFEKDCSREVTLLTCTLRQSEHEYMLYDCLSE